MLGLKPIKLLPARERVASALRKAIISKKHPGGCRTHAGKHRAGTRRVGHAGAGGLSDPCP